MVHDVPKLPSHPRVVRIPPLPEAEVVSPEVADEWEDPYDICDRGKGSPWVTLSLLCKNWPDPSTVFLTTSVAQWQ